MPWPRNNSIFWDPSPQYQLITNREGRFFAQQCGEKAVKALWVGRGEDPWGHSIQKLISEIPDNGVRSRMEKLLEEGSTLDRYYIPTRYPNGIPDLTPGKVYFKKDAELCIHAARRILQEASTLLETL